MMSENEIYSLYKINRELWLIYNNLISNKFNYNSCVALIDDAYRNYSAKQQILSITDKIYKVLEVQ